MQLDGAGWHKAKGLKIPSNIHFIQQPPYSPEVNPTEHLWDEIREKHLHNKIFDSLAETMEVVCREINELNAKPDNLNIFVQVGFLIAPNLFLYLFLMTF